MPADNLLLCFWLQEINMSGNIKIADLEEKHFSPGQTDKYGPMRIPTDIKQQILRAIANIEYGSVEVVVQIFNWKRKARKKKKSPTWIRK